MLPGFKRIRLDHFDPEALRCSWQNNTLPETIHAHDGNVCFKHDKPLSWETDADLLLEAKRIDHYYLVKEGPISKKRRIERDPIRKTCIVWEKCVSCGEEKELTLKNFQPAHKNQYREAPTGQESFCNSAQYPCRTCRNALMAERPPLLCKQIGCTKQAQKKGLCVRHGAIVTRCKHPDCPNQAVKGGLCVGHGAQLTRCKSPGCTKKALKGGICFKHGSAANRCQGKSCNRLEASDRPSGLHKTPNDKRYVCLFCLRGEYPDYARTFSRRVSVTQEQFCVAELMRRIPELGPPLVLDCRIPGQTCSTSKPDMLWLLPLANGKRAIWVEIDERGDKHEDSNKRVFLGALAAEATELFLTRFCPDRAMKSIRRHGGEHVFQATRAFGSMMDVFEQRIRETMQEDVSEVPWKAKLFFPEGIELNDGGYDDFIKYIVTERT